MENKNITKNQHYIPQVYLRGFSLGDDRVCRYEVKNGKQQKNIPIKSIFAEKYLYEKQDENGLIEPNRIENLLRKFEDEFAERREKLTKLASNPANCKTNCFLTADEKLFWKKYIILQMMRHADSFEVISQMLKSEAGLTNPIAIHNTILDFCMSMYSDTTPDAFEAFLPIYRNVAINICYDPNGSLFTNEKCGTFYWRGFYKNGGRKWDYLCFPLSRFLVLYMYNLNNSGNEKQAKNKLIYLEGDKLRTVKRTIADGAWEVIISPKPLNNNEIQLLKKEAQNVIL